MDLVRKLFVFFMVINVSISTVVYADTTERLVNFEDTYSFSSDDLYETALLLVQRYPELLEIEVVGYSEDHNPLYVIRLFEINSTPNNNKYQYLLEAGTHAREAANPAILLTMLEDYILDYYSEAHIPGYSVSSILSDSVLHFYIITNPDGFDLSKFGLNSIESEVLRQGVMAMPSDNYPRFKANLLGHDFSYSFDTLTYLLEEKRWAYLTEFDDASEYDENPTAYNYKEERFDGTVSAEIPPLEEYIKSYDFRVLLSFHSMGQILYYGDSFLSDDVNSEAYKVASIVSDITDYPIIEPSVLSGKSGYLSDFFEAHKLKPAITIETFGVMAPVSEENYLISEYNLVYKAPLAVFNYMRTVGTDGYYDYKMYIDGVYTLDFMDYDYAEAFALRYGGVIVKYAGKPVNKLSSFYEVNPYPNASDWAIDELGIADADGFITDAIKTDFSKAITREEFCEIAVVLYDRLGGNQELDHDNPFTDTTNPIIIKAYNAGIINGIGNNKFAPNANLTRQELCTMIIRLMEKSGYLFEDDSAYTFQKDYIDEDSIATWAMTQVRIMNAFEIMNGTGDKLEPLGTLTVEQAVIMLERTYQHSQQ